MQFINCALYMYVKLSIESTYNVYVYHVHVHVWYLSLCLPLQPCPTTDDGIFTLADLLFSTKVYLFLCPLQSTEPFHSLQVNTIPLSFSLQHEGTHTHTHMHMHQRELQCTCTCSSTCTSTYCCILLFFDLKLAQILLILQLLLASHVIVLPLNSHLFTDAHTCTLSRNVKFFYLTYTYNNIIHVCIYLYRCSPLCRSISHITC